jgi:uncharacterized surface protein with fasciclin (FAS1) repeats
MFGKRVVNSALLLALVAGGASAQCTASKQASGGCDASKMAECTKDTGVVNASFVPMGDKDIVDTAVAAGQFNTLATALKAAGLVETLKGKGPFTVFAPTDEAFAKLPKGTLETLLKPENKDKLIAILTYHVVPGNVTAADVVKLTGATTVNGQFAAIATSGGKVTVAGANVVKTDVHASNGVIHVIDSVILPADKDIVETAVGAGKFNTLATALKAAGLVETLKGKGPFTVFAPTDEAFAKLGKATLDDLLKPENKAKLTKILTYHVVPGRIFSPEALKAGKATTVEGGQVTIASSGGGATVDNAKIISTDINTTNGVIHVIDTVIIPK